MRAPRKDPVAAAAYYAEEARAAGLAPNDVDAAAGTNTEATVANVKRKRSIINTATRGDEDKQRIATPRVFIRALEQRFGVPVDFDLAAETHNTKAGGFFFGDGGVASDALTEDWSDLKVRQAVDGPHGLASFGPWHQAKLAFLNPPFANIKPWALGPKDNPAAGMLACRWLPRITVMLVPASYSTDWFLELRGKVQLDAIPRIQFEGQDKCYPKDLVLVVAGFGMNGFGYWDWRVSYLQWCIAHDEQPDPIHAKGCAALVKAGSALSYLPDYDCSPDPFCKLLP